MKFLNKFGITINNMELLKVAVTHKSYSNENGGDNYERLEFLGDSVLSVVVSEYLITNYEINEGELSKKRAMYVCENALYEYAKIVGYIPYIRVGKGQLNDVNKTIVADIFEAVIAAIFLDQGFEVAKKYIKDVVIPFIENNSHFYDDYKTALQEMVQTSKKTLEYIVVKESGKPHEKVFEIEVVIDNIVYGKGTGRNKKDAEQQAAFDALKKSAQYKIEQ